MLQTKEWRDQNLKVQTYVSIMTFIMTEMGVENMCGDF